MSRGMIASALIGIWLGCLTVAAAQLPPEVLVDKYLLQATMLSEEKDHKGALEAMDRIVALQQEHDLTLPEAFSFQYAQTALAAGSVQRAIDSANRYLSVASREDKYYREALELLVKAERILQETAAERSAIGKAESEIEPQPRAVVPSLPHAQKMAEAQPAVDCRKWNTYKFFREAMVEDVTACLEAGADPNARSSYSKDTPLHVAARYNENPAVIEALLKAGADPNVRDDDKAAPLHVKDAPLHVAARYNENPAVIEALLKAGADPNVRDDDKAAPLHVAARYNENPAVIEALLKAGTDPNARSSYSKDTPLHDAAKSNENPAVIEALLKAGADPNARDKWKDTPLHDAAKSNENPAVIEALLKAGADPNVRDDDKAAPLHDAAESNENPAVIEALLKAGADPNVRDDDKDTPLHVAARYNENPAVIEALLKAGADPNVRDDDKDTPLHVVAKSNENPAVIEALLQAGADPNARDKWKDTPLHVVAKSNENPAVIEALLKAGVDPNVRDDDKDAPLHVAARYNENPAVIEALLKAGADLAALNKDGRSALYLAKKHNDNPAVRQFLLAAGAERVEEQMAAARERRKARSGDGSGWAALVAGVTGAAIGAAGGLDASTATELGAAIGGSVLAGEAGSNTGGDFPSTPDSPEGSPSGFGEALRDLENSCGERYRSGFSEQDHGRFYCLDAFARHCALKKGPNQQQLDALRHDFEVLRSQGLESRCPYFGVLGGTSATGNEREAVDRANKEAREARQQEQRRLEEQGEARQAAQERKRIEENNARVLASDCECISKDEEDGKLTCLDGFVGMTCDIYRPR